MNVAITCDSLLERNQTTEIVELLCEAFPESMIYTLVHKEKAILGTIEQRKIASSGLSRKVHSERELYQYLPMIPSIAKTMKLSCQHELILNVSSGFSHAFSKCEKSKMITYLYDLSFDSEFNSWWKKIFKLFVKRRMIGELKNADILLVSNENLQKKLAAYGISSEVQAPPFRLSDYALFPKEMFKHDFYAIDTRGLNLKEAQSLVEFFKNRGERFQFIGPTDHLLDLVKASPENYFFGERCSGEHAPVLAAAKAFLSFDSIMYSKMTLAALATGRPVLVLSKHQSALNGEGVFYVEHFDLKTLNEKLALLSDKLENFDHKKIRANVMQFHDIKFKAELKRIIDRELKAMAEKVHHGPFKNLKTH